MPEVNSSKYLVTAGWQHAPHLDEQVKAELLANTPPHLRDARTKGTPSLGMGAIYPVEQSEIRVTPFAIPAHFKRGYGLDVGWNRTAAAFGAWDVDADVLYITSCHYRGQAEPSIHADAIKQRGEWLTGAIDPAANGRQQRDGEQLIADYRNLGLNLINADNAVEAGILAVWQRLATGRLKVFAGCEPWFSEHMIYRRDEKGRIVKANDHCLHPDTLVITDKGRVPIRSLVGTDGWVLSRDGTFERYRNCRMTAPDQEIVEVSFADGSTVRCTPDHKFLTVHGWVEAIDLAGVDCYNAISHRVHEANPCWSTSYPQPSRSSWASAITCAASIFSGMAAACTSLCGLTAPGASRPGASTSTTRTRIARTISRTISRCWQRAGICRITSSAIAAHFQTMRWLRQQSGTARIAGANGIAITTSAMPTSCMPALSSPASNAASCSSRSIRVETASARTPAKRGIASILASITSSASASLAANPSPSIAIARPKHAAGHARLRCDGVRPAGRSDVYCLTVPATAAFAVESGVVVHNCMDATRYLVMSMVAIMRCKPVPRRGTSTFTIADSVGGY